MPYFSPWDDTCLVHPFELWYSINGYFHPDKENKGELYMQLIIPKRIVEKLYSDSATKNNVTDWAKKNLLENPQATVVMREVHNGKVLTAEPYYVANALVSSDVDAISNIVWTILRYSSLASQEIEYADQVISDLHKFSGIVYNLDKAAKAAENTKRANMSNLMWAAYKDKQKDKPISTPAPEKNPTCPVNIVSSKDYHTPGGEQLKVDNYPNASYVPPPISAQDYHNLWRNLPMQPVVAPGFKQS